MKTTISLLLLTALVLSACATTNIVSGPVSKTYPAARMDFVYMPLQEFIEENPENALKNVAGHVVYIVGPCECPKDALCDCMPEQIAISEVKFSIEDNEPRPDADILLIYVNKAEQFKEGEYYLFSIEKRGSQTTLHGYEKVESSSSFNLNPLCADGHDYHSYYLDPEGNIELKHDTSPTSETQAIRIAYYEFHACSFLPGSKYFVKTENGGFEKVDEPAFNTFLDEQNKSCSGCLKKIVDGCC